jgi:uncharacterized protein YndB with AHSA1/START domain
MSDTLPDIVHAIEIASPRTAVWTTLTDAAIVPQWLGCLNYEGLVGHTFHMQPDPAKRATGDITGATHCDVEELVTAELFRFSWYMPDTPKTIVSIKLEPVGEAGTRATLTHSGWEQFPADAVRPFHAMLDGAWKTYVLPSLKRVAEAAKEKGPLARPFCFLPA